MSGLALAESLTLKYNKHYNNWIRNLISEWPFPILYNEWLFILYNERIVMTGRVYQRRTKRKKEQDAGKSG